VTATEERRPAEPVSRERLAGIVAALPPRASEVTPGFALGSAPPGGLRLDRPGAVIGAWLDREIARVEGGDSKLGAAYLIGRLGWSAARGLSGLALAGAWACELPPAALSFDLRMARWQDGDDSGIVPVADAWLDPTLARFSAAGDSPTTDAFRAAVESGFAPAIEAAHEYSGLPRAALWRLVGDSLSAAFLAQGKALGCTERAMALALPMFRQKGTRLYSQQTGFFEVTIPERPKISDWFRQRGGCCRYYTSIGGEYCSTCVLRDKPSRDARLIDHLRQTHAGEAA